MRQIGVLPDAFQARALADYLLTLRIETRVEQEADGHALWVCDEDRVSQARQELEAFLRDPHAKRYADASGTAEAIRRNEDAVEEDYGRRQTELRQLMVEPPKPAQRYPFTAFLVAAAIVVAVLTRLGEATDTRVFQLVLIAPIEVIERDGEMIRYRPLGTALDHLTAGEVWRVFTPAVLHFGFIHLLFNLIMLVQLGIPIEERRGTWRYAILVLAAAAAANVAQYYVGWLSDVSKWKSGHSPNPLFGGLSGVNYALFGYLWMKSRYQPEFGFVMPPHFVIWMVGWFLLCFTGQVGPIANVAHTAGLGLGIAVGAAPTVWRRLTGKMRPSEPEA
jgi:GlpG protein